MRSPSRGELRSDTGSIRSATSRVSPGGFGSAVPQSVRSGSIAAGDVVELKDDRGLQPAENVTPFVREDVLERGGASLARAIEKVSAHLSTDVLRTLNARASDQKPRVIAETWLRDQGLLEMNHV